jgi:hypothetical protein
VVDLGWFDEHAATLPGGPGMLEHMRQARYTPQQVSRIATAAGVGHVLLSRNFPGDPSAVTDRTWSANVRKTYKGRVTVGRGLTQYGVGAVQRRHSAAHARPGRGPQPLALLSWPR